MSDALCLLHVADTHVAERTDWDPKSLDDSERPADAGHDPEALASLSDLFVRRRWRTGGERVRLVVAGDLTRNGGHEAFGVASLLLHQTIDLMGPTSLKAGDEPPVVVPGNKDLLDGWDATGDLVRGVGKVLIGRFVGALGDAFGAIPARRTTVVGSHFPHLPSVVALEVGDDPTIELHLAGLDSCSGLGRYGSLGDRGSLDDDELEACVERLDDEAERAAHLGRPYVRAVVMHHPPRTLRGESMRRFGEWAFENGITVTLTGHDPTHGWTREHLVPDEEDVVYVLHPGVALQYMGAPKYSAADDPVNSMLEHRLKSTRDGPGVPYVEWLFRRWSYAGTTDAWVKGGWKRLYVEAREGTE